MLCATLTTELYDGRRGFFLFVFCFILFYFVSGLKCLKSLSTFPSSGGFYQLCSDAAAIVMLHIFNNSSKHISKYWEH